jgi:tRNA 2-thiocytidine biosynthesis protein TtcA
MLDPKLFDFMGLALGKDKIDQIADEIPKLR